MRSVKGMSASTLHVAAFGVTKAGVQWARNQESRMPCSRFQPRVHQQPDWNNGDGACTLCYKRTGHRAGAIAVR